MIKPAILLKNATRHAANVRAKLALALRQGAATTAHAAMTAAAQTGDVRAILTSDRNARAPTVASNRKAKRSVAHANIASSKTAARAHHSGRVSGLTHGLVRVQVTILPTLSQAIPATRKNGAAVAAKAVTGRPVMKQMLTIKASIAVLSKDSTVATDMLRAKRSTAIGKNVPPISQQLILRLSMMQHLKRWAA